MALQKKLNSNLLGSQASDFDRSVSAMYALLGPGKERPVKDFQLSAAETEKFLIG